MKPPISVPTKATVFQLVDNDRRWACPGFFRMPEANDGGICRIKLSLGQLNTAQILGIADAADAFSNGYIELTSRGNIQLRAVHESNKPKLIEKLLALGLGPLTPNGDDIRNVMVAPTAGIDTSMLYDTRRIGKELLYKLQTREKYAELSPKFSFLINSGESTAVHDHVADIWVEYINDGKRCNFGFASRPFQHPENCSALGSVSADSVIPFIETCLLAFIDIQKKHPSITRMKHLIAVNRLGEFLSAVIDQCGFNAAGKSYLETSRQQALIGIFPQIQSGFHYVGARPALGRVSAGQMHELADLSDQREIKTPIRITHHQGIIIPDCSRGEAESIQTLLTRAGFATHCESAASKVYCCAGGPICRSGLSNVQRDGRQLIELLDFPCVEPIHLTACAKSCVATVPFAFTALATQDGVYSLYKASESAEHTFGIRLAVGMDITEIARYMNTENQKA